MYKEFSHIEDLITYAKEDKGISGTYAAIANRYPIRFVLFDNFRDSFGFVFAMQSQLGCLVKSVNEWMDAELEDTLITHSQLADCISDFVRQNSDKDSVIAPFSELARFYDNKEKTEFDTLISTIKAIETTKLALSRQQRVYIPIVGLEGKMSKFSDDSQIVIWYFKNPDKQLNYNLILTNSTTYEVQGLEMQYSVVQNMQQWLKIWRDKDAKQNIISTSAALYANSDYANPDNAFAFYVCHNVYEFLIKGLSLDFGAIEYKEADEKYWLRLAKEIDVPNFSLEKFFNQYFHIDDLSDYNVFLKTWFDCHDGFERWLLTTYYAQKFCQKGYICQVIKTLNAYTDYDFFAAIALTIFDLDDSESNIEERTICLQQAAKKQIKLTSETQNELVVKLKRLAEQKGVTTAIRYFSPLTDAEKSLAIIWLSENKITKEDCNSFFPDLYNYLNKSFGTSEAWVLDYIDAYKQCKISNTYKENIENYIKEKNASTNTFNQWYQDFKTVKTILNDRKDIEVYFWIDGLGIDWIPYINYILQDKENIFLNETYIARANYPTTTEENKPVLLDLSGNKLQKIGDLDAHAHKQGNKYPDSIIEEMEIVKAAIKQITDNYAEKKIAIVADHGLTALSQLRNGLNLAGIDSDHGGRIAIKRNGNAILDSNYVIAEDNKTMCALRHESLCGKIPLGQSAHGGCTPEEILVPIFIISSQSNATNYSATLLTKELSGTEPIVKYSLKGLSDNDIPYILYNGKRYELNKEGEDLYCSDKIHFIETEVCVELHIGTFVLSSLLKINLGAKEDNLFDF
ncbi:MAG TPA: BREX-4 system phosphatase PglZ [Paludibacteraceae bacterium]|nr:BREX-4 system phosphatase PglZ [Paludibacteraceae bacterium]